MFVFCYITIILQVAAEEPAFEEPARFYIRDSLPSRLTGTDAEWRFAISMGQKGYEHVATNLMNESACQLEDKPSIL
jgi:hypothetical protein